MMRSLVISILVISLAAVGSVFALNIVSLERERLRREEGIGIVMPSAVARIVALEFKGIFADIIFSRAMTYYGGKLIREEELTGEEWDWIYKNMDLATDLDNYFLDPYYFGAVNLSWGANKVKEANALLEKALKYRDWDWTIPFNLGFNHFYFLQDNKKAASYLIEASKRPGSGNLIPTLGARLEYEGNRTENAVIFLEENLKTTDDETIRYIYEERLKALKSILFLERAVTAYQSRFNKRPKKLEDLIARGIISEIPKDPYGGQFYIDEGGSIKTTSGLFHK
ncbi:MAG: hypothetical protein EPN94_02505 [Nitrospirae bacterium]|nr:MAG: hypothetical protein EPN94_02505 [Nitrospirota bacterium]